MPQWFETALRSPYLLIYEAGFALFLLAMGAEAVYGGLARRRLYEPRDAAANLSMYAGYFLAAAACVPWMFLAYSWAYRHRIATIGAGGWHLGGHGHGWEWALLLFLDDLTFYVFHRASHRVRLLWASHVNHHSSRCFNLSVAFRQSWFPFLVIPFWMPLCWLGFDPLLVMTMQAASLFYQSWLHTQVAPALGPLEWVLNTPRHHRLHHGENDIYLDKNFGGILIVWDRLFGTFAAETEPVRYGVGEGVVYNPLRIALDEWGRIGRDVFYGRSIRDVWGYVFATPGWRPKGLKAM